MSRDSLTIRKAARLLDVAGWIQHAYARPEGYCMIGALSKAAGCSPGTYELTYLQTLQAIAVHTRPLPIVHWNDLPGRTKKEVIALLHTVAAELEAAEQSPNPESSNP